MSLRAGLHWIVVHGSVPSLHAEKPATERRSAQHLCIPPSTPVYSPYIPNLHPMHTLYTLSTSYTLSPPSTSLRPIYTQVYPILHPSIQYDTHSIYTPPHIHPIYTLNTYFMTPYFKPRCSERQDNHPLVRVEVVFQSEEGLWSRDDMQYCGFIHYERKWRILRH